MSFFIALAAAAQISVPAAMSVGDQSLAVASCGVRAPLWIEHYAAALYVAPRDLPAAAVQDPARPKALQVRILNTAFMPQEMPRKWRRALRDALDGATFGRVSAAYRSLDVGDIVTVTYAPQPGVTLEVNGEVVARTPSHRPIEALLHVWADGDPVPERVGRAIARNPCRA